MKKIPFKSTKAVTTSAQGKQFNISPKIPYNNPVNKEFEQSNASNFTNNVINNTYSCKIPLKSSKGKGGIIPFSLDKPSLDMDILKEEYKGYKESTVSTKSHGLIKSFAFNTYKGIKKDNNEDKVLVIDNIKKPNNFKNKTWPKMSLFAIFDGHGGDECSQFVKDKFLEFLLETKDFPIDIKSSLKEAVQKCEEEYYLSEKIKLSEDKEYYCPGTCACILLIVDQKIYAANVGDSRAILSLENGSKIKPITIDHKANNPREFERMKKCGGKVYIDNDDDEEYFETRNTSKLTFIEKKSDFDKYSREDDIIFRCYPSDLAVSRTIGDYNLKDKELGGIPNVIISTPEIYIIDHSSNNDFILIGCDGIFDELSNKEIIDAVWYVIKQEEKEKNHDIHLLTLDGCDMVMKYSLAANTTDNISCIIIGLEGLEKYLTTQIHKENIQSKLKSDKK